MESIHLFGSWQRLLSLLAMTINVVTFFLVTVLS